MEKGRGVQRLGLSFGDVVANSSKERPSGCSYILDLVIKFVGRLFRYRNTPKV